MLNRKQLTGANFSFQHHPFRWTAEHLHATGFDRMELWGIAPHLDLPLGDYRAELGAHGFTGTLTFEPFGNGSYALDPVSTLRRCLDAVAPHFNQAEQA